MPDGPERSLSGHYYYFLFLLKQTVFYLDLSVYLILSHLVYHVHLDDVI